MSGQVIQTVEVAGSAFGMSYANERWGTTVVGSGGELQVAKMPVDLGGAVVLKGLSFFGAFGKHSEHTHNVGNGLLACYASRFGGRLGRNAKTATKTTAGLGEGNPYAGYQQHEMAGMGRSVG